MIEIGDCRDIMRRWASEGVKAQTCVTSPPYFGLRDYGHDGQIGLEQTPSVYVREMVEVFRCVWDVMADDGTLWLNLGDSYASAWVCNRRNVVGSGSLENGKRENRPNRLQEGLKEKDLMGIPWRVAFALQEDGWYLRQDIIWHKPNPMPESVRDRCTKAHEYIFLLSKSQRYYFDSEAMQEPATGLPPGNTIPTKAARSGDEKHRTAANLHEIGARQTRNRRSVWTVATQPYSGAHFATYPPALIEPCILAGSRPGDLVLDPFMGSGTTAQVAQDLGRKAIGCELNPDYVALQSERAAQLGLEL
jgi:DNA modification methylase